MHRRRRGEGAVYRRKDGRWEARLRLPGGRRTSIYTSTRRQAVAKLADAGWRVDHGLPLHASKRTVADYLNYWLEVTRRRVRPTTFEAYELNVRRMLPHIGYLPLSRLEPSVVQATYDYVLRSGLSPRSVEQMHAVLHRALDQALHWGLIIGNPTELVAPPRPKKREMTALTAAELQRLLATTRNQQWYPLWVILSTTGLRIGEALALDWESVNLDARRLVVVRSLQRQRGVGLVFAEPKTARSRRSVHLGVLACDALCAHRSSQESNAPSVGRQDSGLVLPNRTGGPQDSGSVTSALNRALRSAGLPHIRVHDLRHTAASVLLAKGVNPKVVQDLLGHSTVLTTLNTYSHLTESLSRLAAETMDAVLTSSS
jgi:integrase